MKKDNGKFTLFMMGRESVVVPRTDLKEMCNYMFKTTQMYNTETLHEALRLDLLFKAGIIREEDK